MLLVARSDDDNDDDEEGSSRFWTRRDIAISSLANRGERRRLESIVLGFEKKAHILLLLLYFIHSCSPFHLALSPLKKINIRMISSLFFFFWCFISWKHFRSCCISQFLLSFLFSQMNIHASKQGRLKQRRFAILLHGDILRQKPAMRKKRKIKK